MNNPLINPIDRLLTGLSGQCLSEHELMRRLVDEGVLDEAYGRSNLSLFQTHFLVMNALYSLRKSYSEDNVGALLISPLSIMLTDSGSASAERSELTSSDVELERYYLDWGHFQGASTESVDALLSSFWERFVVADDREWAIGVLGLEEPVVFSEIKHRYRAMVMKHHPDRGGCNEKVSELNEAMSILKNHYRQ